MKVSIVGAGIAGLYSAYILQQHGIDVTLYEASERAGGRIKTHLANGHPFELGAEYIHGKHSVLFEMAEYLGLSVLPEKEKTYYWYRQQLLAEKEAEEQEPINDFLAAIENQWRYHGEEKSVHSWFAGQPFFPETAHLLEAWSAEYGTSSTELGMSSLARQEKMWASGAKNFRLKAGFRALVDWFEKELNGKINFNCTVKAINYQVNGVELAVQPESGSLETIKTDRVVVTLPLGVLKRKQLHFLPELPTSKQQAIEAIGYDAGSKVFIQFKTRFWPADLTDLWGGEVCAAYTSNPAAAIPILCAYLMGEKARKYQAFSEEEKRRQLLGEIEQIFGNSSEVVTWLEEDWAQNILSAGVYSYASRHAQEHRKALFEPINRKVFFAGEACHSEGHPATVHGAMETAEWVAKEILEAL